MVASLVRMNDQSQTNVKRELTSLSHVEDEKVIANVSSTPREPRIEVLNLNSGEFLRFLPKYVNAQRGIEQSDTIC